ncbi:CDP-alcohol phosphatidyltransferase family protein [Paeniglutamicibacter antarcticus]|uniref:CDP-alcohol phosphatidyltransferase family protein n=1 Tax=Paeniglutamicibacter antarcticus TaxID=494023 RepID=A0ABP9TQS2_9MICC
MAAIAFVLGTTPNKVTGVSAAFTFSGIILIASFEPVWWLSMLAALLLALGYALDSADGQLARLQGKGSAAGEWLDHVVDAIKTAVLHLAVLICWYRFYDLDERMYLLPIAFQVVASVLFFAMILTDQLRRLNRGKSEHFLEGQGSSSTAYSLAVLPTDYGLMCVVFALLFWHEGFIVLYALLLAANSGFLALALVKWFREVSRHV